MVRELRKGEGLALARASDLDLDLVTGGNRERGRDERGI